jgi:hypothetical protein
MDEFASSPADIAFSNSFSQKARFATNPRARGPCSAFITHLALLLLHHVRRPETPV